MKSKILLFVLCVVGLFMGVVALVFLSLPNPGRIKGCLTTEFKKVKLCPGDGNYVSLKNIAPILRQSVLISEDASFYSHNGFDWHEMRESVEKNLSAKGYRRGGSTITQQLAKNVFLTGEKSLLRKAKEAYLTWRLESILSKDQILEKYLNVVELGPGIFGVRPAARHYFNKTPAELNAAESAFLALLLPNPIAYYTSFRHKKLTPFARSRVLDITKKLNVTGRLTDEEYAQVTASLDSFPWKGGLTKPVPEDDPAAQISPEDEYFEDEERL